MAGLEGAFAVPLVSKCVSNPKELLMTGDTTAGDGVDYQWQKYADADGYDSYMGTWSVALSPPFLDFVGRSLAGATIVDIGCGTGNLLIEIAARHPDSRLYGLDPSSALLGKARRRSELADATLTEGSVELLPLPDGSADAVLSMLVLQEFSDRSRALQEMVRVTRDGGIVAACQWDFAKMPIIAALVETIASIDPSAGAHVSSSTPAAFKSVSELSEYWTRAGLIDVRTDRLAVSRTFASFDDLWAPLLAGSTPSTLTLASLPEELRAVAYEKMRLRFRSFAAGGAIEVRAEALAVVGVRHDAVAR